MFLERIEKHAEVIRADEADGFSPADCVDDILDKAPPGDLHAKWISKHRQECEQAIAGIMGLM
jgi:hypothetical protein